MGNKNIHVKTVVKIYIRETNWQSPKKKESYKSNSTVINDIHIQFVLLISTLLRQDDIIYELKLAIQYYYVKLN